MSGRRPWSLAARLTAWYAGSAFLLILGATGFLYWMLGSNLDREDDQFLADKVHLLRTLLRDRPDDLKALRQEAEEEWAARKYAQVYVRIQDSAGATLFETAAMHDLLPTSVFPPPIPLNQVPIGAVEVKTSQGKMFRVLAAQAVGGEQLTPSRIIQLAFDRTFEEQLLADYRRSLWLVLVVSLLLCTLVGYRIAHRGLRPLSEVTTTARRIRATTLHERIPPAGLPAELSHLAETFNEMLDRLQASFDRLSQFSADIAHELRTPVNNLRGEAEVALSQPRSAEEYQEVLRSSLEEGGRLTRMINNLLFLARAESPAAHLARERLDIGQELNGIREFYEAAATEAGIKLEINVAGHLISELDRTLFQRAVSNLVANALSHTPLGGAVTIEARGEPDFLRIDVIDTGSGIAPQHLPHVFDRFYRVDSARSAAEGRVGLGLALVKSILTLHGGNVSIESKLAIGTRVILRFPGISRTARLQPASGQVLDQPGIKA